MAAAGDDDIIGHMPGIDPDFLEGIGLPMPIGAFEGVMDNEDIYASIQSGHSLQHIVNELSETAETPEELWRRIRDYGRWLETNHPPHWDSPRQIGAVRSALMAGKQQSDKRILSTAAALDVLERNKVPDSLIDRILVGAVDEPSTGTESYSRELMKAMEARARRDARRAPPAPPSSPSPGMDGRGRAKKALRPPICRIGTKKSLLDKVFRAFPDDSEFDTYVEPFVGGGAVYWAKEPSKREVINDLDSELIGLYRLLKTTKSRDFRTDLTSQPVIQSFFNKGKPRSDAARLQYGIVASCNRWMGRQTGNIIYKEADPHKKTKNIDAYQERMKGTIIHNESYEKVLRKYDSPRTFFYLDPPYENSKTLYKATEKAEFDFPRLRDELARLKGKWLLSINDSKYIRDLFKGFYAKGVTVKAKTAGIAGSVGMNSIGSKDRKELLIANYKF